MIDTLTGGAEKWSRQSYLWHWTEISGHPTSEMMIAYFVMLNHLGIM
jgi:hypothetical protein